MNSPPNVQRCVPHAGVPPAAGVLHSTRLAALVVAAATIITVVGAPPTAAPANAALARNYLIGDSVVILVESSLRRKMPRVVVDAVVSRQVSHGIEILQRKKRRGTINRHTVFALGTNGTFTAEQLEHHHPAHAWPQAVCRHLSLPLLQLDRRQQPHDQAGVHAAVPLLGRTVRSRDGRHPEWFAPDGVHLPMDGPGARAYAALVRDTIHASYD